MLRTSFGLLLAASLLPAASLADPGFPAFRLPAPIYAGPPEGQPYVVRKGAWSAGFDRRGASFNLDQRDGTRRGVRWRLLGAREVEPHPEAPLPARVSEYVGAQSFRSGLQGYGEVHWKGALPGVDLVWRSRDHDLEWLLKAAPGAAKRRFTVEVEGVDRVVVEGGTVRLAVGRGELFESGLACLQPVAEGAGRKAACRYADAREVFRGTWRYTVEADGLDPSLPLVVDPSFFWSVTFGGTSSDSSKGLCVLGGYFALGGWTLSTDMPSTSRTRTDTDAFVSLIPVGFASVETLYLGGASEESMQAMACGNPLDSEKLVYLTGATESTGFANVGDKTLGATGTGKDAWLARVAVKSPLGSPLVTYIGSDDEEAGAVVAVAPDSTVRLALETNAVGSTNTNIGVYALPADLSGQLWDFPVGGTGVEVLKDGVVTSDGVFHFGGRTTSKSFGLVSSIAGYRPSVPTATETGFVIGVKAETSATPTARHFSWVGANVWDSVDALATNGTDLIVGGTTKSDKFPLLGSPVDTSLDVGTSEKEGFVLRLNHSSSTDEWTLGWSTALGGAGMNDQLMALGYFGGDVYATGVVTATGSFAGFPALVGPQPTPANQDFFLTRLTPEGQRAWTRFFGSPGNEMARALGAVTIGNQTMLVAAGWTDAYASFPVGSTGKMSPGPRGAVDPFLLATDLTPPEVTDVHDGASKDVDVITSVLTTGASVTDAEDDQVKTELFYTRALDAGCGPEAVLTEDLGAVPVTGSPPWQYTGAITAQRDTRYFAVVRATNSTGLVGLGCSNGFVYQPSDAAVPGPDAASPRPDAASAGLDAAAPGLDATSPRPDATAAKDDAGAEPVDAEAPAVDAAAASSDASTARPDASATGTDAGDGGTPGPAGVLGWSCGCAAAGGGALPLLAAALPLLGLRRRRAC